MSTKESPILKAVLELCQYSPLVYEAHRMNVGAVKFGEEGAKRFVRFSFPGCSDCIGVMGNGLWLSIETKAPGKKPTENQCRWLFRVWAAGGHAGVAYSVDDASLILRRHPLAMAPVFASKYASRIGIPDVALAASLIESAEDAPMASPDLQRAASALQRTAHPSRDTCARSGPRSKRTVVQHNPVPTTPARIQGVRQSSPTCPLEIALKTKSIRKYRSRSAKETND